MEESVKHGILFNVPEPKSPHGADVTPDGRFVVVSGKLDPHVTIFSFEKIQKAGSKALEFGNVLDAGSIQMVSDVVDDVRERKGAAAAA